MTRRSLLALTLLLAVALAGCGGTTAPTQTVTPATPPATVEATTETPTETSPTSPDPVMSTTNSSANASTNAVTVSGGDLPFDPNVTYQRVERLLAVEEDRAATVSVSIRDPSAFPLDGEEDVWGPFATSLGITGSIEGDGVGGFASGTNVVLYVGANHTAAEIEPVLAHEFTHVLLGEPGSNIDPNYPSTFDTREAKASLIEGAATYTEDVYIDRYLPGQANYTTTLRERYGEASPALKLLMGRYRYGARYVDQRVDSPQNLSAVYDTPPWSTEQVLHGYSRETETRPPVPNAVVNTSWSEEDRVGDTRGELFTRVALGTELNHSVATSAAAGWEGDTQLALRDGGNRSYVWTLYWENETEADEFLAAAERYVEGRAEDPDAPTVRLERTSERSTTLLVGQQEFVETVSVSVGNGTVRVDAPEGYN
ncbi:hypothetical protein ACFPYI_08870 [Halomarina salina]|uniref:Lipoprotein n=1 Tax=Halomarina salina TaxID=1872699 RepID=A0ABD5RMB2_9EURY|nr:hypothetical protein [Halomarina salina]